MVSIHPQVQKVYEFKIAEYSKFSHNSNYLLILEKLNIIQAVQGQKSSEILNINTQALDFAAQLYIFWWNSWK